MQSIVLSTLNNFACSDEAGENLDASELTRTLLPNSARRLQAPPDTSKGSAQSLELLTSILALSRRQRQECRTDVGSKQEFAEKYVWNIRLSLKC
jgi:hypothetical protein